MTASLARFLPDFELSRINAFQNAGREDEASARPPEPEIDIEAIRAEARAEGDAAARAELAQTHENQRKADAVRHKAELEALRTELEARAAHAIPAAIAARSQEIADLVAGDVEAVLAPLIDKAVRARIMAGLADEIRSILELETAGRITVSGPDGLVAALREAVGPAADRLQVRETDAFDIEVDIDRTRFATRLSAWAEALSEALA